MPQGGMRSSFVPIRRPADPLLDDVYPVGVFRNERKEHWDREAVATTERAEASRCRLQHSA